MSECNPDHGADHLSHYDLARDIDEEWAEFVAKPTPICATGQHQIVRVVVCRLCGEAMGLEEEV